MLPKFWPLPLRLKSVSEKLQLAKDIGIDLSVLSVDSMALGNLVTRWDQPPPQRDTPEAATQMDESTQTEVTVVSPVKEKFKMILAIGHTNTIALFFSKGVPQIGSKCRLGR
jgi:Tfp pilus assembly PilM family ATPase